jgi:hypothetical protein
MARDKAVSERLETDNERKTVQQACSGLGSIRDLADFYLRWSEFRPAALEALDHPTLSSEQHLILSWLVMLADRIGPCDLAVDNRSKSLNVR